MGRSYRKPPVIAIEHLELEAPAQVERSGAEVQGIQAADPRVRTPLDRDPGAQSDLAGDGEGRDEVAWPPHGCATLGTDSPDRRLAVARADRRVRLPSLHG